MSSWIPSGCIPTRYSCRTSALQHRPTIWNRIRGAPGDIALGTCSRLQSSGMPMPLCLLLSPMKSFDVSKWILHTAPFMILVRKEKDCFFMAQWWYMQAVFERSKDISHHRFPPRDKRMKLHMYELAHTYPTNCQHFISVWFLVLHNLSIISW